MFLASKLITCFIDEFTSKRKSQSIFYLLNGSKHIYWTLDLENEVHSMWVYGQVVFKIARAISFFEVRQSRQQFTVGIFFFFFFFIMLFLFLVEVAQWCRIMAPAPIHFPLKVQHVVWKYQYLTWKHHHLALYGTWYISTNFVHLKNLDLIHVNITWPRWGG